MLSGRRNASRFARVSSPRPDLWGSLAGHSKLTAHRIAVRAIQRFANKSSTSTKLKVNLAYSQIACYANSNRTRHPGPTRNGHQERRIEIQPAISSSADCGSLSTVGLSVCLLVMKSRLLSRLDGDSVIASPWRIKRLGPPAADSDQSHVRFQQRDKAHPR